MNSAVVFVTGSMERLIKLQSGVYWANVEEGSEIKYFNHNPQGDVMKLLSFVNLYTDNYKASILACTSLRIQ